MNTASFKIVILGGCFLFVFLSGFWLSHAGKPLNGVVLAFHKLLSLAALVLLAVTVYGAVQATAGAHPAGIVFVAAGLLFIATIATGGLLSTGKPVAEWVGALHRVMPYLTVLSSAASLYFALGSG